MNSIHKAKGLEFLSEISYLFRLGVVTADERNYMSSIIKNSMSFNSLAYFKILNSFVSKIQKRYNQTQKKEFDAITDFSNKIQTTMEVLKNG